MVVRIGCIYEVNDRKQATTFRITRTRGGTVYQTTVRRMSWALNLGSARSRGSESSFGRSAAEFPMELNWTEADSKFVACSCRKRVMTLPGS